MQRLGPRSRLNDLGEAKGLQGEGIPRSSRSDDGGVEMRVTTDQQCGY